MKTIELARSLSTLALVNFTAAMAQAQSFPSPIPLSPLQVAIRDVARLPNPDSTNVPRMSVATRDPSGRLFVNDQRGPLYTVDAGSGSVVEYIDIRDFAGIDLVNDSGEQGFQGFAFHPDFHVANAPGFGRFYTFHSSSNIAPTPDFAPDAASPDTVHHEVLLEWRTNDPAAATFASADSGAPYRELIRFDERFRNHDGGNLAFSPLGGADRSNLYVALGDGGSANDPFDAGQDTGTPFGKLLRIDPLGNDSANGQYGIVADNVLAADGDPNTLGEIYSYGLRNPQRFGWDTQTSNLYIADIGQDAKEEINIAVNGGNFGWDLREGSVFPADGFINPVAEWEHSVALAPHPSELPDDFSITSDAVTMGEVYRGSSVPQLDGFLLAGDNPKGLLYILDVDSDALDGGGEGWTELIPLQESSGLERRLITIINEERALLGLPDANRADLRFSVNTPGEVFILNKQDGVVRVLTLVPEPTSWMLACLGTLAISFRYRTKKKSPDLTV